MGGRADEEVPRRHRATSASTPWRRSPGALAWPFVYPWPQRPAGPDRDRFDELARALDADPRLRRGERRRRLLRDPSGRGPATTALPSRCSSTSAPATTRAARIIYDPSHFVLQQLDYLDYIDIYHERIRMFHVKDAEFNPTGRQGVYSGFQPLDRSRRPLPLARRRTGRLQRRSSRSWRPYDFDGWAVLEWECCLKHPEDGAREGAAFIATTSSASPKRPSTTSPAAQRRDANRRLGSAPEHDDRGDARQPSARIRLGMVGGGEDAFIGAVHRIAARLDDDYELVAGALSSTPEKARALGGGARARPGPHLRRLRRDGARPRRARPDGIEAVAIVTPNHMHAPVGARLPRSRHPRDLRQAADRDARARRRRCAKRAASERRALRRSRTTTPAIRWSGRRARWCAAGELGEIRVVQVEYAQDWLTEPLEPTGQKQADWRTDPARTGRRRLDRRHRHPRLQPRAASSPA